MKIFERKTDLGGVESGITLVIRLELEVARLTVLVWYRIDPSEYATSDLLH